MKIDWFTIAAQTLNFLVLVWLMRHFLYKPILNVIDEREKRIVSALENAEKKKNDAQKEHNEFEQKNEDFDKQHAALLSKATDEVQAHRQKLLDEARTGAEALRSQQRESLRNETNSLHQEIGQRLQQEVFAITRKTLMDLAGVDLEERLSAVFVRRLREMDSHAKEEVTAMKNASEAVLVRSAFDLPATLRSTIQNEINETFSAEINLRFEIAPGLISGIELNTNGHKVAWSIAGYLSSMEKGIEDILDENGIRETKTGNESQKPEPELKK